MSLLSILMLFLGGVKQSASFSTAESLSRLWGQSILSEYDLNLYRRYHLFGFYGYPEEIKEKLRFYSGETGFPWNIESCSLYAYSLRNTEIFYRQIVAAGKLAQNDELFQPEKEIIPVSGYEPERGGFVFEQRPSEGSSQHFSMGKLFSSLKNGLTLGDIIKSGTETYFELCYLFSHFKNRLDDRELGPTYLEQEIEYIVGGKTSDAANEKFVKNRIIAIREMLNLFYLNKNPKTRKEAFALAEILTPGPTAAVTQQTLLSMWALAESLNDYKLLIHGYRVQTIKTESSWAVELASVLENRQDDFIYTGIDEGQNYQDYLGLLLSVMDKQVRILRAMDLIQINFRWMYYEGFLLREYNGGLAFTYQIYGRTGEVEMQYEKEAK